MVVPGPAAFSSRTCSPAPDQRPAGHWRRDGRINRVGHTYALPVIKLLFATARTCAYPGSATPLVFIDEDRDVREVAVQIAHIRSPKPDGPRYDTGFPPDQLNSDGNLLLLCGVHHHPVDRNGSKYTTAELLEWKRAQATEGGGFSVQDDNITELVARLESSLDELVQATRLQMRARLVGGRLGYPTTPTVVLLPLEGLEEAERKGGHLYRPGRLIGVEVENRGPVGAEVRAAGIDIDHGPAQGSLEVRLRDQPPHAMAVPLPGRGTLQPGLVRDRAAHPGVHGHALSQPQARPAAVPGLGRTRERRPPSRRMDRPG